MTPKPGQLAMRDPALMAHLGLLGGKGGNFGHERAMRRPMPQQRSIRHPQADFGQDWGLGSTVGYEFGYSPEFGADAASAPAPTANQALAAWHNQHAMARNTERREQMLEPNKGSLVKVQHYFMSLSQSVTLGTAVALNASVNPTTNFRPQRTISNAPTPGFFTITALQVGNVNARIGGTTDAFIFSALAQNVILDLPTITPAYPVSMQGSYGGYIPPGYVAAASYDISLSFVGPASMVG